MRKSFAVFCALMLIGSLCIAQGEETEYYTYTFSGKELRSYSSESIECHLERFVSNDTRCYLTKIWMRDPGRQICKATAAWQEGLSLPSEMAEQIDNTVVVINGSGYVSPVFPWIPENYPGTNSDYYYTPLGSLTVTHGEVMRKLEGVPYYGLTLEEDGLHMYVGADNDTVLNAAPRETWSFYTGCPLIENHKSIVDTTWDFANARAIRTIIAKVDTCNYVVLTVTRNLSAGWTLMEAVDFLLKNIDPEWAYDLDGGPSSALLFRYQGGKMLTVYGDDSKDADIMAFTTYGE